MKINLKINRAIFWICIIHMALLIVIAVRRQNHVIPGSSLGLWITILSDITFLLPLMYLAAILKLANEKKYIVNLFLAYGIIEAINFAFYYMPRVFNGNSIVLYAIGVIISLFMICIVVISFNVKHWELRLPFRIFAIVYILLLVINWGIPLLLPLISFQAYYKITPYIVYSHYIPIVAISYIIYKAEWLINNPQTELLK